MAIKIKMKNILDVGTSIVLRKLGFGKFDNLRRLISIEEYGGEVPDMDLWLIPADKYDEIPNGYPVTDIFGKTEPFAGRKTCCKNDIGPGGLLPIGVLRPAEPEEPATEAKFITSASIVLDGKTIMAGTECTDARMLHVAVEAKAGSTADVFMQLRQAIKNMHKNGMDADAILKALSFSKSEIEDIIKPLNNR